MPNDSLCLNLADECVNPADTMASLGNCIQERMHLYMSYTRTVK